MSALPPPKISVIILNYNGAAWLARCLASLKVQTIFPLLEVIVADNASPDRSDQLARELVAGWPRARVIQHGENLGFCEGNNRAALTATGDYLFFLNNDTWLQPDCIEVLLRTVKEMKADAGTPMMLNYEDTTVQSAGGEGFDIFGLMSLAKAHIEPRDIFVVGGCSYLIRRELFNRLGGFDSAFYMYADEYDLSWRVWVSGARAVIASGARLHHRGAASVNPAGGGRTVELRTSDTKRYYTNRNCLLVLLKSCQHLLLLMVPLQLLLLAAEAVVGLVLFRRWSFVKRAYLDAVVGCWKLRRHVWSERKRIAGFRHRGDFGMLRFLCLRLNRWDEIQNLRRHGLPKITAR